MILNHLFTHSYCFSLKALDKQFSEDNNFLEYKKFSEVIQSRSASFIFVEICLKIKVHDDYKLMSLSSLFQAKFLIVFFFFFFLEEKIP